MHKTASILIHGSLFALAISPELTEFFHDQVIRTNSFLSLRCTASGNPPPRIYWYLDGGLILPQGDYVFGSYMHVDGEILEL